MGAFSSPTPPSLASRAPGKRHRVPPHIICLPAGSHGGPPWGGGRGAGGRRGHCPAQGFRDAVGLIGIGELENAHAALDLAQAAMVEIGAVAQPSKKKTHRVMTLRTLVGQAATKSAPRRWTGWVRRFLPRGGRRATLPATCRRRASTRCRRACNSCSPRASCSGARTSTDSVASRGRSHPPPPSGVINFPAYLRDPGDLGFLATAKHTQGQALLCVGVFRGQSAAPPPTFELRIKRLLHRFAG